MALQQPGPTDRANCPSGGYEFALTVWRYVRVLALAARAEGQRQAGNSQEYATLDALLGLYVEQLLVSECGWCLCSFL